VLVFDKRITCCYLYPITKYGYPPSAEKTNIYLEEMNKLGFSSVELEGIRENHLMKVYEKRSGIKEKLIELNLDLPFFCAVLPGLSSLDEKTRKKNIELFEKGCKIAAGFNSKGILDNAPIPPFKFPEDIPVVRHYEEESLHLAFLPDDFSWKKFWEQLIDTFRTLCDIAAEYKLTYQIHPAVGVLSSTADGFLYLFDAVKKDNLRFNFDTANLFAVKENLPLSLIKLKDHIDYLHISDNSGFKVEHLELGKGKINWEKFFETLDIISFKGNLGIDIGGDESNVENMDEAYISAAKRIEDKWLSRTKDK
jgi:sugar phosphate isomerase/epimerase